MTPAPAAAPPQRFAALDAWRGVCALLVAFFHLPVLHALKGTPAFANLQLSVDFFFVLSGFVLSHAYGARVRTPREGARLMLARVGRLWPLHVVVLAGFVALEAAKLAYGRADASLALDAQPFAEGHSVAEIGTNLLFLQAFGLHPGLSWNFPAWSAAVEFYMSAIFAAVFVALPRRRILAFAALSLGAGAALFLVSPKTLFVSYDWGMLRCLFGFGAGCVLYALRPLLGPRLPFATAAEIACLAIVALYVGFTAQGPAHYAFPLVAALVIGVFAFEEGAVSGLLLSRPLQALGAWSYSIYMVHALLFQVLKTGATFLEHRTGRTLVTYVADEKLVILGTPWQALAPGVLITLALVLPAAALTYHLVERPGITLFRRLTGRRPAPTPDAVPAAAIARALRTSPRATT